MDRQGTFDYILLETTGLADPGNIAPLFWVDDGLGSSIYLDGIVTLVDVKNILRLLDEPSPEETIQAQNEKEHHSGPVLTMAHLQIAHADVIVLNKSDLVTHEELQTVRQRITSINGAAKIHVTDHSRTPQIEGVILDLHAYDHLSDLDFSEKGHAHIDPSISTIAISHQPIATKTISSVDAWLRSVLWESILPVSSSDDHPTDFEIHRLKGLLALDDGSIKVVQAVRDVFEIRDVENRNRDGEDAGRAMDHCKIVIIGRNLGKDINPWQRSLEKFLEASKT
jgi:G3E family GTPase